VKYATIHVDESPDGKRTIMVEHEEAAIVFSVYGVLYDTILANQLVGELWLVEEDGTVLASQAFRVKPSPLLNTPR
jgi:hypothetical protein